LEMNVCRAAGCQVKGGGAEAQESLANESPMTRRAGEGGPWWCGDSRTPGWALRAGNRPYPVARCGPRASNRAYQTAR